MTSARFENLDKRVKTLRLKRYMKLLLVFVLFAGAGYYYVFDKSKQIEVVKVQEVIPKVEEKRVVAKAEKVVVVEKKEPQYDTIKLTPTIAPIVKKIEKPKIEKKSVQKVEEKKTSKISMRVKEVKSEEALLKRFRVANDFDSAMGLANLYFSKGEFEKSIYWSRKASKLRSGEESAWLVFAKAKHALGKSDDAINALKLYLEHFSSKDIEKLLKLYRKSE